MKLTCPKCRARCFVPDDKVPQAGAWAQCPQCAERFFIRPQGFDWAADRPAPGAGPPQSRPDRAGGRSPEAQALLDRLRPERAGLAAAFFNDEDLVILSLLRPPNYRLQALICSMVVLIAVTAAFLVLKDNRPPGRLASPPTLAPEKAYGREQVRTDLIYLRREIMRRTSLSRSVNYSGAESRIFKYFIQDLNPETCREISALELSSERPASHFEMRPTCLNHDHPEPGLLIRWLGSSVEISSPPRSRILNFPIFPVGSGQPAKG
ncbi:MAG: zinc-ribbon domain-containing protein [Candidatus Adiutrix sp.]|jgi:predicted Zn finger-like uncharacterized protein|nr:zinc-ribbon domain-containing protein [Candidatus Adiutrix sp.]